MSIYYRKGFKIKYGDNCGNCEKYTHILKDIQNEKDIIAYVTGERPEAVALTAVLFLRNNIKTVLLPWSIAQKEDFKCYKQYKYDYIEIFIVKDEGLTNDWILGMFTSGSTGIPKLFGFSSIQINRTLDWYHEIYKTDERSLIITAMPVTYNFTFIAGVCNMASVGGTFISAEASKVPEIIEKDGDKYSRIVILANPVLLDNFSDRIMNFDYLNLLVDSGGAPLSKNAIKIYRENGIDLREGYGLTETCSLTHFDTEAIQESMGTVGTGMEGCKVEFVNRDDKDFARIYTPNLGRELKYDGQWFGEYEDSYLTTDIVRKDSMGRLEILGRKEDTCLNGYWPKDTLDLIGEIIGVNCALVQHIDECVVITFLKEDITIDMDLIKKIISENVNIEKKKIRLHINDSEMLHSMKIRRKLGQLKK